MIQGVCPLIDRAQWSRADLEIFVEVSETSSLNQAAKHLDVHQSTLTGRLTTLEQTLGFKLFDRSPAGATITERGALFLEEAKRILITLSSFDSRTSAPEPDRSSHVEIAATDGLIAYWLVPWLRRLIETRPDATVDMFVTATRPAPYSSGTDIQVSLVRPELEDLVVRPLGRLNFLLYASRDYVEKNGEPTSLSELSQHRFVNHHMSNAARGEWYAWNKMPDISDQMFFQSNLSSAVFSAVDHGLGIGMLPSYASHFNKDLVPLAIDVDVHCDLYLSYLKTARNHEMKRVTADWLMDIFDKDEFPYFGKAFVNPRFRTNVQRRRHLSVRLPGVTGALGEEID